MNLLISMLKIIFTFATVFFAALPFVFEYHTYLKDKEKKTANRRFRIMCFTMIYVAALTFALCALRDVITAVGGLSVISWLAVKLALPVRTAFFSDVVGALLINFAIGFLFRLLLRFVRIGMGKRSLSEGEKPDGAFSLAQKVEIKIIKLFRKDVWVSAASILKKLSIFLSAAYVCLYVVFQLIALFGADWIPFDFLSLLFNTGTKYPVIALFILWESFFFLDGINEDIDKCPEPDQSKFEKSDEGEIDVETIDEEIRNVFGAFYACDVDVALSIDDSEQADDAK